MWKVPLLKEDLGRLIEEKHPGLKPDLDRSPALIPYGCNLAAGDVGEEFIEKLH